MKLRTYLYIAVAFAACLACKKKDDEYISLPELDGTLKVIGLDEFLAPGAKIKLTPTGVTHPEGGEIGYYWKILPSMPTADTLDVLERTISDTLGTYTIYCTAFAEGYTSSSLITYTTTVKAGKDGSVQGIDAFNTPIPDTGYYQATIGDQIWLQNNLHEGTATPYRDAEITSDVLGRYYTFNEAKTACESLGEGWVLPSKEDWEKLETYIKGNLSEHYGKTVTSAMSANATFNTNTMWEYWPKVGPIKNGSGFSAIPVGYAAVNSSASLFDGFYQYATFWTSTETEDGSMAYYKYLIEDQPKIFTSKADKNSFGASVRCIKK